MSAKIATSCHSASQSAVDRPETYLETKLDQASEAGGGQFGDRGLEYKVDSRGLRRGE